MVALDVGKALNPFNVERQIEGSLAMGIGSKLYEKLMMDSGKVVNADFMEYKIPGAQDISEITPLIVEAAYLRGRLAQRGWANPAWL